MTVATPDYTVTPQGAATATRRRSRPGSGANNGILERLAAERGIAFVDILRHLASGRRPTAASSPATASTRRGAQYALWVDRIAPIVEKLLRA